MNKDSGIWVGNVDKSKLINVCKQITTINGQNHYPHPFYDPEMKYVYFNADVNKKAYVHRVNVSSITKKT